MEESDLVYKSDSFGNDIVTRVNWSKANTGTQRPVVVIYHAGGLPNYRLVPQVTGREAFQDAEDALTWTRTAFPNIAEKELRLKIDTNDVVAIGHSSGGTMVLHLAALGQPLRAVTALYPFLFVADKSTEAHRPSSFSGAGVAEPTEEEWAEIAPSNREISEAPFTLRDDSVRSRWIKHIFSSGRWMSTIQPDGIFAAIDPMTRVSSDWAPTRIIHGGLDNVPGCSVELAHRAAAEFKTGGHTRGCANRGRCGPCI